MRVILLLLLGLPGFACLAEPIRLFYSVGPEVYEVARFKNGIPDLDTKIGPLIERVKSSEKWSYSGKLEIDATFMANAYPYQVGIRPRKYPERHDHPEYYVSLLPGVRDSFPWKSSDLKRSFIVLGWLVDGQIQHIMCSSGMASEAYELQLELSSGIDPSGKLVAWLVDKKGSLVAVPKNSNPLSSYGVQRNSKVNKTDSMGNTALHIASINGDLDLVEALLMESPKSVESRNRKGRTPLMYSALAGRFEVAEKLLGYGASQIRLDHSRSSALNFASERGFTEMVKFFTSRLGNPSAHSLVISTAAMASMENGHEEIAILLLSLGADISLTKDEAPKKAMSLMANGYADLSRWVRDKFEVPGSYSDDGFNFLHVAAGYGDGVLLEELVAKGAPINQVNSKGLTPLLIACGLGNREAICWLMENGASKVEAKEHDPIIYAIRKRVGDSVSCLVDYGVSVNREVEEGLSPLMYACRLEEREIAETLLAAGGLWLFSSPYSDNLLRDLIKMDSVNLVEGLLEQGLEPDHLVFGMIPLLDVARFHNSTNVYNSLKRRSPKEYSTFGRVSDLRSELRLVSKIDSIDYPVDLQKKYGNVNVATKLGVLPSGEVALVDTGDSIPSDLEDLVISKVTQLRFKPFKPAGDKLLYRFDLQVPLRISLKESDIFALDKVDVLPKALWQIDPNYPPGLKEKGIGGYVILEWVIDADGVVHQARGLRYSSVEFVEPAIVSILKSKWAPARRKGIPVAVRVTQRMDFNP